MKCILIFGVFFLMSWDSYGQHSPFEAKQGFLSYDHFVTDPTRTEAKQYLYGTLEMCFLDSGNILGLTINNMSDLLINGEFYEGEKESREQLDSLFFLKVFYSTILNDSSLKWEKNSKSAITSDKEEQNEIDALVLFTKKFNFKSDSLKNLHCELYLYKKIPIRVSIYYVDQNDVWISRYITISRAIIDNQDRFKRMIKKTKKRQKYLLYKQ